jgi:hypothetical protein
MAERNAHPSLFIPHVFPNISESRIYRIIDELALGSISKIDMVEKENEKGPYNRVYIHFKHWYSNRDAETARNRLLDGKEFKIVYDEPWFWKVSAYKPKPRITERSPSQKSRPRLILEEEEETKQEEPLHPNVTVRRKQKYLKKVPLIRQTNDDNEDNKY